MQVSTQNASFVSTIQTTRHLLLFLVLAVCSAYFILFWGSDRGFDTTDEAFYVLTACDPERYPWNTSFGFFMQLLPKLCASPLISYRIYDILFRAVGGFQIAAGVVYWLEHSKRNLSRKDKLALIALCLLGGCLSATIGLRCLSYNGLNTFFLCTAFYALCRCIYKHTNCGLLSWSSLLGAALALDLTIKFPSAVAFAFIAIIAGFYVPRAQRLRFFYGIAIGGIVAIVFFFVAVESPATFSSVTLYSIGLDTAGTHNPVSILETMVWFVFQQSGRLVLCASLILAIQQIRRQHRVSYKLKLLLRCTAVLAAIIGIAPIIYQHFFLSNSFFWFVGIITTALALSLRAPNRLLNLRTNSFFIQLILFSLPFVAALGSDNHPLLVGKNNLAPWLAMVWLQSRFIASALKSPVFSASTLVVIGLAGLLQLLHGFVLYPYRISSLIQQKFRSPLPRLASLKLSSDENHYFSACDFVLRKNGFHPGDELLVLFDNPGLVYVTEALSPGQNWYTNLPDETRRNLIMIRSAHFEKSPFIALSNTKPAGKLSEAYIEALRERGIAFPTDFHNIGAIDNFGYYIDCGKTYLFAPNKQLTRAETWPRAKN